MDNRIFSSNISDSLFNTTLIVTTILVREGGTCSSHRAAQPSGVGSAGAGKDLVLPSTPRGVWSVRVSVLGSDPAEILLPAPAPQHRFHTASLESQPGGTIPGSVTKPRSMSHVEMAFDGFRGGWDRDTLPVCIQI